MLQILGLCSLVFDVTILYLLPRFSNAVMLLCNSAGSVLDLYVEFQIWFLCLFFVDFCRLYVNLCMHMCVLP